MMFNRRHFGKGVTMFRFAQPCSPLRQHRVPYDARQEKLEHALGRILSVTGLPAQETQLPCAGLVAYPRSWVLVTN
jgi:hypothetical protein